MNARTAFLCMVLVFISHRRSTRHCATFAEHINNRWWSLLSSSSPGPTRGTQVMMLTK